MKHPNTIRIFSTAIFVFFSFLAYSQTVQVTGKVSDEAGPLPGVTVKALGINTVTVTDYDGNYAISVPVNVKLQFSFTGYQTIDRIAEESGEINVTLQEMDHELEEVVVVGYGTMRKRDVTGAISSIRAEELVHNEPINIANALQGKISGLEILTSSEPGSTSSYRIRGASTLDDTGSNPLFIVDGLEVENIDFISPRDILSVEVLKDAASAAIYGSKSANGVVIITTKMGSGVPKISINYTLKQTGISRELPQMNRREGIDYDNLRAYYESGSASQSALAIDTLNPSFIWDNNYQHLLFKRAFSNQVDASISGSDDKLKYFVSAGYLDDQGIQVNSYNKRITSRINIDYNATQKFSVGNRLSLSTGNSRVVPGGARRRLLERPASMALIFEDGSYAPVIASRANPLAWSMLCINDNKYYDINFYEYIEYKFTEDLRFKSSISGTLYQNNYRYFAPAILSSVQIPSSQNTHTTNFKWTHEDILTYNTVFNNDHSLTALLGFSLQDASSEYLQIAASDNISEAIKTSSTFETVNMAYTRHSWTANRLASFFGRVSYAYKGKYLFNSNLRYDGSSRFGRDKRWGLFPSASFGWRFSDESFMRWSNAFLNDAKLRYSFGKTGNQTAGNFAALSQYATIMYADYIGIYPVQLENNLLSWEDTQQHNLGLDLSLFNSRVELNVDLYQKETHNILFNMKLPRTTGFATSYTNTGGISNKGYEITLSTKNIQTKDFEWTTNLNFAINKNKIVSIPEEAVNIYNEVYIVESGYTLGAMYGYKALQIFPYDQSNAFTPEWQPLTPVFDARDRFVKYQFNGVDYDGEVKQLRYGTSTGALFRGGDVMWEDINGDGVINAEDRQQIGCGQHDFIGGFSTDLKYKAFTLSAFFSFAFGGDVYNAYEANRSNHLWSTLTMANPVNVANSWKAPGDIAKYPVPTSSRTVDNTRATSSLWIEDGSYIRLKNLRMAYQLPKRLIKVLAMETANLSVQFENYFTWSNYSGFDPEIPSRGFAIGYDDNSYPKAKSIIFGLNINF